ncbi:unnamed protein product [Pseudo-nitzschia multistriata]|uniref:Mitochondrial carrier protein n=1 Tax=Pseudo-nitzschia multistriata TaxID=183589 RepID=A0A448ZNR8_9STRA|nr:unnamed protein product [Pseudo-nitzschia multistriata]
MKKDGIAEPPGRSGYAHVSQRPGHAKHCREARGAVWKDLLAGGIAGTVGIGIGHPFDTIKVRFQQGHTPPEAKRAGIPTARTPQPSPYRGLYRGLGAPLATAALVNASVFCVYGATARQWDELFGTTTTWEESSTASAIGREAFCGGVTGFATSLLICPIELVKVQLQTLRPPRQGSFQPSPPGTLSVARQILGSEHGLRGLYRGLLATALRQTPSLAIYFPVYRSLKDRLGGTGGTPTREPSWYSSALAGGLAGCVSWAVVYPIDVLKSRIQSLPMEAPARERSLRRVARQTLRNEGLVRLMCSGGLAVTLLRAFPVNGAIFFVYELASERLAPLGNPLGSNGKSVIGAETSLAAAGIGGASSRLRGRITSQVECSEFNATADV